MASATICSHVKKDQDIESHPSKKPKIHSDQEVIEVDYSSKTTMTSLHGCKMEDAMDALLFDCEVTMTHSLSMFNLQRTCLMRNSFLTLLYTTKDNGLWTIAQNILDTIPRIGSKIHIPCRSPNLRYMFMHLIFLRMIPLPIYNHIASMLFGNTRAANISSSRTSLIHLFLRSKNLRG